MIFFEFLQNKKINSYFLIILLFCEGKCVIFPFAWLINFVLVDRSTIIMIEE